MARALADISCLNATSPSAHADRVCDRRPPALDAGQAIDALKAEMLEVVVRRQELREKGANAHELEENRMEIVRLQWTLSYALIGQRLPPVAHAA
jgi:hypothetical protein